MTGATFSGNAYATYQEPIPSGTGGCSGSSGTGSALVTWADRSTTVLAFRSGGSAAAIGLNGTVLPSLGLALTGYTGPAQAPPGATYVVTSTRFARSRIRRPMRTRGCGVSSAWRARRSTLFTRARSSRGSNGLAI